MDAFSNSSLLDEGHVSIPNTGRQFTTSMKVVAFIIFVLKILPTALLATSSSCPTTQYSGRFRPEDGQKGRAISGQSYKNITIKYVQQCFGYCVYDCKCLSFQVFGTRCELLDEDKDTVSIAGYEHFVLKQRFKNKYSNIDCSGGCRNGCCHTNPCMNGGACVETCEDVRRKFKCICPLGIQGRYCQFIVSCTGIPANRKSGIYTITGPSLTSQFKVYCDFTSEPNYVWTLVESFKFWKQLDYYYWKFHENHPVSESSPNWLDYRLSLEHMKHIRTNATHWRATCNFDSADISTNDYVQVEMKTVDVLQSVPVKCYDHIGFLRLKGKTCTTNCKTRFETERFHPYLSPCVVQSCEFVPNCSYNIYEAFGAYEYKSNKHTCSSSPDSTTNWWIGHKIN